MGGVTFWAQVAGSAAAVIMAVAFGTLVYMGLKHTVGIRLSDEEEIRGADLSIHNISAYPEHDVGAS
jgi:Amt family ammonium transporter